MTAKETKDEHDRAFIWDCIYKVGPRSISELRDYIGREHVSLSRMCALVNHEWFTAANGVIYIANVDGRRTSSFASTNTHATCY